MQIADEVKQIVSRQLGVELAAVEEKSSFIDDLGADSLAIVELVLALEEHFKIEIPESQTERIRTVGDAIAYIQANRGLS
jgi:acyl carrier protein